jgi:PAS domain S-box-containing protein
MKVHVTRKLSPAATVALVGVLFLVALTSARFAPTGPEATWWPGSAIAACLLLLTPAAWRLRVLAVTVAVTAAGALAGGASLPASAGSGAALGAEAFVVCWWLTRHTSDGPRLRTWNDAVRLAVGALLGSGLSAVVALPWLSSSGIGAGAAFLGVLTAHLAAALVAVPLALTEWRVARPLLIPEAIAHWTVLAALVALCYFPEEHPPLASLILCLVWAAARFTPLCATLEMAALAVTVTVLGSLGHGPFVADPSSPTTAGSGSVSWMSQMFVLVSAAATQMFILAISQERRSERRVVHSEASMHRIIESATNTAVMATDAHGLITVFNPGAEQLLGYSAEEVLHQRSPLSFHDPVEIAERAAELGVPPEKVFVHALEAGADHETGDWTYVCKDGTRRTVSLTITPLRDADGGTRGHLSVVGDVTDRRSAEQALLLALQKEREVTARLRDVEQAKADFVSTVSHELRTPLTSIIGYTELLDEGVGGDLTPAQQGLVTRIETNGERLLHLVEDLLTLSSLEGGRLGMDKRPGDLRDIARRALEDVTAAMPDVAIASSLRLPGQPVTVYGDPCQLARLVTNLLENAFKFTGDDGHVDLAVSVEGETAVLRVSDDGIGIPQEEREQLFERFFRGSAPRRSEIRGTGLGLSIVESIVAAHDGQVSVHSTVGAGTTFTVTLPLITSGRLADELVAG